MASDQAFWDARIASVDLNITAYEAAILAFATNGAQQEYSMDTGQKTIRVERADADVLHDIVDRLISQRDVYCIRAGRASSGHNSRPSF